MTAAPLLAIERLTVDLPGGADRRHAVEDLSLEVGRNEILCIVGESGSGKSMTAHAIVGLLPSGLQARGSVRLEGVDLLALSDAQRRRIRGSRIGMIFQEPMAALNPVMRVGDQIVEVFRFHGVPGPHAERVVGLLQAVGLPEPDELRHAYPFRLSGGQRQRVMIAMALALDPALLIADEPTTALDVTTQAQILRLLKEMQARRDMAIVLITHDFGVVAEVADRVAVMQGGRLVEVGAAGDILSRPRHPYTRELLAAVPRLAPRAARRAPGGEVALRVTKVAKRFRSGGGLFRRGRNVQAIAEASFTLERGETLGIVGESGSGKSTLARIIVRLVAADRGDIRLAGIADNLLDLSGRALKPVRRRIQMVFQDPYASLNPRRTVFDIVAQGLLAQGVDRDTARARVSELLRLVALEPGAAERYPNEFSGGQRQRIGIARALALDPEILVADEPVSALDVSVQAQILQLLASVQQRLQFGLLFITHDLRVAAQVCDRVAVMRSGEIVEIGPSEEVLFTPRHDYTRLLIGSIPGRDRFEPAAGPDAGGPLLQAARNP